MRKKRIKNSEKAKNGFKIKALDVVIILLIITVVVGVYFRYNILDMLTGSKDHKEYIVSFEIKDIQFQTYNENYIQIDDNVYFYDSGELLGTLIGVNDDSQNALRATPTTTSFIPDNETQAVELSYPPETRVDANGRMKCLGTYSAESGFLLKGIDHIAPGDIIAVKTNRLTVNITVTDITVAE